jgi:hypothetical protein
MVRLTPGNTSVLQHWSDGRASLPATGEVIELTRGVVAPGYRGLGLYSFLMLEAMLRASQLGARAATAAVEPDFFGRRILRELGFTDVGEPLIFRDTPRDATVAQGIRVDVSPRRIAAWRVMWTQQMATLERRGWRADSDLRSPDLDGDLPPGAMADSRPRSFYIRGRPLARVGPRV